MYRAPAPPLGTSVAGTSIPTTTSWPDAIFETRTVGSRGVGMYSTPVSSATGAAEILVKRASSTAAPHGDLVPFGRSAQGTHADAIRASKGQSFSAPICWPRFEESDVS